VSARRGFALRGAELALPSKFFPLPDSRLLTSAGCLERTRSAEMKAHQAARQDALFPEFLFLVGRAEPGKRRFGGRSGLPPAEGQRQMPSTDLATDDA